ncbi:YraN family protein [Agromyces sp. MMS17-SY077]|uniref:UPF0102 protein GB864_07040 n=2 Tax=Agromyces seonyuensis TaxID=2662446 RepID=A0A6I4NVM5_9MICO|nr:YraN family protein [Agromyces seonyuensis]MWB98303.1 YraN family protein [Agromyces seonyuensis]
MARKDELGRLGERIAAEHLEARGMRVLERNWRCRSGELDLVALDGDETVFVEVKTRSGLGYGHPFEAITARKVARLRALASAWAEAHERPLGRARLDAVAVLALPGEDPVVEHLRGIG